MKLFYHPVSPNCHKVLLALYEKGIECEKEVVNIFDPEAHAQYKQDQNPIGKVPFLRLDDGYPIPESSIIIEYLDTHFDSGPKLLPADKTQHRKARFIDRVCDLYVIESGGNIYFEGLRPEGDRHQDKLQQWREKMQLVFKFVNEEIQGKEFVVGNSFSLADITLSCGLNMAEQLMGFNLADWPHAQGWLRKINERPSWQKIFVEAKPVLAAMMGK